MSTKSDVVSIFRGTRGTGSREISAPGAFTAAGFPAAKKNPGASAAGRGRLSLFKTIDEDRRAGHDHINRSGRSTYPEEKSVQTSGASAKANGAPNGLPDLNSSTLEDVNRLYGEPYFTQQMGSEFSYSWYSNGVYVIARSASVVESPSQPPSRTVAMHSISTLAPSASPFAPSALLAGMCFLKKVT